MFLVLHVLYIISNLVKINFLSNHSNVFLLDIIALKVDIDVFVQLMICVVTFTSLSLFLPQHKIRIQEIQGCS